MLLFHHPMWSSSSKGLSFWPTFFGVYDMFHAHLFQCLRFWNFADIVSAIAKWWDHTWWIQIQWINLLSYDISCWDVRFWIHVAAKSFGCMQFTAGLAKGVCAMR